MEHILHSLETGETGMERASSTTVFDWLAAQPQEASSFNDTMIGFHGDEPLAVAAAYDFSGLRDSRRCRRRDRQSSGRHSRAPSPGAGILSDLPHVIREARPYRAPRLYRSHHNRDMDFFGVPLGGDAYLLSHVIHDWSEEPCVTILCNCRRAMKPGSRLLS